MRIMLMRKKMVSERNMRTKKTIASVIVAVALVIAAAMVLAFSSTVQEVDAQGPPPKAQLILSTPPSERGAVASGGQGGGCGRACG